MATSNNNVRMPQTYFVTKSTAPAVAIIREALSNNKGKLFSLDDIKKLTGKKWVNGFMFFASRERLEVDAPEDFPIVAVKKGRKVIGYMHQPKADTVKRNAKGHMVKPTNIVGKWEAKLSQRTINAQKAEAAASEAA